MMPKRAKVAYAVTTMGIGGVSSVVLNTIKHIDRQKYDPVLLVLSGADSEQENELQKTGTPYKCFTYRKFRKIIALFEIWLFFMKEKIMILHGNPGTIFRAMAFLAGVPVIVSTYHGTHNYKNRIQIWGDRILNGMNTKIIAISRAVKEFITGKYGYAEEKVEIIYNGIDAEGRFNPDRYKCSSQNVSMRKSFVITCISGLSNEKGLDSLIRAAVLVQKEIPGIVVQIVGTGDYGDEVRRMIEESHMENTVKILGKRNDIPEILIQTDVSILPSAIREGLGLALIESMSMRIPVIGTSLEGIKEVVSDGVDGYLVEVGNYREMAARVLELLKDGALRERMGLEGRKKVLKMFNVSNTVKEIEKVYEKAMVQKGIA